MTTAGGAAADRARPSGLAIPVGVNLTTIGVTSRWWLDSAARVEAAGFSTAWAWDHFVSRGRRTDPLLECWTTLAATAATTRPCSRGQLRDQRHEPPPCRAGAHRDDRRRPCPWSGGPGHRHRRASGGACRVRHRLPASHRSEPRGWRRPSRSSGRSSRVARPTLRGRVLPAHRCLRRTGPGDRHRASWSPARRRPGRSWRRAAGDGWITFEGYLDRLLPVYLEALAAAGRRRSDVIHRGRHGRAPWRRRPPSIRCSRTWPASTAAWQARGADELVLHWIHDDQLEAVLAAGERAAA